MQSHLLSTKEGLSKSPKSPTLLKRAIVTTPYSGIPLDLLEVLRIHTKVYSSILFGGLDRLPIIKSTLSMRETFEGAKFDHPEKVGSDLDDLS